MWCSAQGEFTRLDMKKISNETFDNLILNKLKLYFRWKSKRASWMIPTVKESRKKKDKKYFTLLVYFMFL